MTPVLEFASRCLLVGLFLPFSSLDKVLNFKAAVSQASAAVGNRTLATLMIAAGFLIEVGTSVAILLRVADRPAAVALALYCIVTAVLWKQFWKTGDFRLKGPSNGRDIFWDFLKNLSLAGGLFLFALNTGR